MEFTVSSSVFKMTLSDSLKQLVSWKRSLSQAVRDPELLIETLGLPQEITAAAKRAAVQFPLMVPRSYLGRMRHGDLSDPLLRQVLPLEEELFSEAGFSSDPVGDSASRRAPGLLHKYQGRALLMATGVCAIHCRYCFRRHYAYSDEPRRIEEWQSAFQILETDQSIHEVILSGGDPLMLSDGRLEELVGRLSAIPHLKRLRIHSRLPIVLPDRITDELVRILRGARLTPIMVVHANHANELVDDCEEALRTLVRSGITTLNQAVLLRGVNDSVDTLTKLHECLINVGVMPYYLHQLDRVQGAKHFEVDEAIGVKLIAELRRRLPGYAVPEYVREVQGADFKIPVVE